MEFRLGDVERMFEKTMKKYPKYQKVLQIISDWIDYIMMRLLIHGEGPKKWFKSINLYSSSPACIQRIYKNRNSVSPLQSFTFSVFLAVIIFGCLVGWWWNQAMIILWDITVSMDEKIWFLTIIQWAKTRFLSQLSTSIRRKKMGSRSQQLLKKPKPKPKSSRSCFCSFSRKNLEPEPIKPSFLCALIRIGNMQRRLLRNTSTASSNLKWKIMLSMGWRRLRP